MFERLQEFKRIVLWYSGGLDSTLLLAILRDSERYFDIYQQGRECWTKEQKQKSDALIKQWNLKVYSHPPQAVSFIGEGEHISVVTEYGVGGVTYPLVADVIKGTQCIADLATFQLEQEIIAHDLHIVGSRKDDTHWSINKPPIPGEWWNMGTATFYAPLYDWTRDEVKAALRERGLDDSEATDEQDTGSLQFCRNCLRETGKAWCPAENKYIDGMGQHLAANLHSFREFYS